MMMASYCCGVVIGALAVQFALAVMKTSESGNCQ
jgi:hypothetical protein